jgi:hypothetical protein
MEQIVPCSRNGSSELGGDIISCYLGLLQSPSGRSKETLYMSLMGAAGDCVLSVLYKFKRTNPTTRRRYLRHKRGNLT